MTSQRTYANRNETFGRLLSGAINSIATYEGKTAPIVEDELGQQIGVAGKTIQRYKSGSRPPEDRTIELLAEAAVQRGFLGREWLQRFLHAARYPFAEKLLDQLCPLGPVRSRPPRVYENLPAPTYSQFVMREQAFAEVIDGLQQRSAAVLIVGMGGNGKTSLAREVSARCLRDDGDTLRFDAAVWVSDKDRPGTTNLSIVLNEIARTLDYPGFAQFEHDEKQREVEQLLKRQRVLLIVDNFETITDGALLIWLLRLPEPSKALVTTREYRREWRSSWPVELRGMSEAEAWELISERARVLKIDRIIGEQAQLEPLLAATGGNPKALTMTMGLLKYERRPLQDMVDDLYAARGDLFDDLFARAWALLDEAARRVLLVATFFPTSASASALSASADVQGFAFDRAVERLADLALIDGQQETLSSQPRYALHPLVRAFAGARLVKQEGFEKEARGRWITFFETALNLVSNSERDPNKLSIIDPDHETILTAIHWATKEGQHAFVLRIALAFSEFCQARGYWDKRVDMSEARLKCAQAMEDTEQAIGAMFHLVDTLSRQGKLTVAQEYLQQLNQLASNVQLSMQARRNVGIANGLYWMAKGELRQAQAALQDTLVGQDQPFHTRNLLTQRWLGICLYRQGAIDEARDYLQAALSLATKYERVRHAEYVRIVLATIDLDTGQIDQAAEKLTQSYAWAQQFNERERLAQVAYQYVRLHTHRGDIPAARTSLAEAIDLFERIGMRRELAEARGELARLESSNAPVSSESEA